MAFRNSVKVTMLSLESEQTPRSYPTQPALFFEPPPLLDQPPAPTPTLVPAPANQIREIPAAEIWHARAEELRAMTDALPSAITRSLMPKIIALYDGLARDEGWSGEQREPEEAAPAPPPEEPPPVEEFAEEIPPEEFLDDDAPLSRAPAAAPWPAFARRPAPRHPGWRHR